MTNLPTAATCPIDIPPPIFPTSLQPPTEQTFMESCLTVCLHSQSALIISHKLLQSFNSLQKELDVHEMSSSSLIEMADSVPPSPEEPDSPRAVESPNENIHFRFSRRYTPVCMLINSYTYTYG